MHQADGSDADPPERLILSQGGRIQLTEFSSGGIADPEVSDGDAAFTMQDWLDSSTDFKTLRRGEVIEGTIMGIQRDGVIVDLGAKSEGVIPSHEMHSLGADPLSKVAVGDMVYAITKH